jgi:uncharacterized protein
MNPQECRALRDLLAQLVQIRGVQKDPEADALIQEALAQQPDATYLLTQRVLLLGVALDRVRARVAAGGTEAQRSSGDYVGSGAAREPLAAPSAGSSLPVAPGVGTSTTAPSFLREAATTAAGVAGGALLFQGIEDILRHHAGLFAGHDAATFLPATEEFTVNNYYQSEAGAEHEASRDRDSDRDDFADADDGFV